MNDGKQLFEVGEKLTPQQAKFAQYIFEGVSQRSALNMAYPRSKEWTIETQYKRASELANNGKVLVRVKQLSDEYNKEYNREERRKEITKMYKDMQRTTTEDLNFTDDETGAVHKRKLSDLPEWTKNSIKRLSISQGGNVTVEFYDKLKAAEQEAKMNGLNAPTDVNVRNTDKFDWDI